MNRKLVCIFGAMGAGKTTFAKMLKQHLDFPPVRFVDYSDPSIWALRSFAFPGKLMVANVMGVDMEFIEKWKNIPQCPPGWLKPVRLVLQEAISYWRSVNPDIWTDRALRKCEKYPGLIIDDGRYESEWNAVNAIGGFCIYLFNPHKPYDKHECEHESEAFANSMRRNLLDIPLNTHRVVMNGGTLDDLNDTARKASISIHQELERRKETKCAK